jgi:hypothetical protein
MKENDPKTVLKDLLLQNREKKRYAVKQSAHWGKEEKRLDKEFAALYQSYQIVGGEPFLDIPEQKPIADLVEAVLREYGKQHVDEIQAILAVPPFNRQVDKQSIVGTIVRYLAQNKRFVRVGKNTFDLLKDPKEKKTM